MARLELYALLLAHHLVRTLMAAAAQLSLLGTLRLIREAWPDFQRYHPELHATLYGRLLEEIAATVLPPRANRSNPRVV